MCIWSFLNNGRPALVIAAFSHYHPQWSVTPALSILSTLIDCCFTIVTFHEEKVFSVTLPTTEQSGTLEVADLTKGGLENAILLTRNSNVQTWNSFDIYVQFSGS